MRHRIFKSAAAGVVAVGMLAGAGAAEGATLRGVVVHHNARAHSFTVADRAGRLYAVHARRSPRLQSIVVVSARRLHDGTFALVHERTVGRHSRQVRIRGVVSYVNRRSGAFTVSAPGVSMLVHSRRSGARAADALPAVGSDVVVSGTDDQGELEDGSVQSTGTDTNGISLEGTILSVDSSARTLTVSADDEDASGSSVTVTVPATLDITQFAPGQEVELQVQPQSDGTYTLLGSAQDENAQSADDQGDEQGDQGDDQNAAPGSSSQSEGGDSTGSSSTSGGQHD